MAANPSKQENIMITFTSEKEWFEVGILRANKRHHLKITVSEKTVLQMHLCDKETDKVYRRLDAPGAILMPGKEYNYNFITNYESRLHMMPMTQATVECEVEEI